MRPGEAQSVPVGPMYALAEHGLRLAGERGASR